jgi:hypothetical protein
MSNVLHRTTKQYLRSVNTPDFPRATWVINPDLSSLTGVPTKYWKINPDDTVVEMTAAEKSAVDNDPTNLADTKALRNREIDQKTVTLIEAGFAHGGKTFSLSDRAQASYNSFSEEISSGASITYPRDITTIDDTDFLTINNVIEARAFLADAFRAVRLHQESGRDLKVQIIQAADASAVDAVVDSR